MYSDLNKDIYACIYLWAKIQGAYITIFRVIEHFQSIFQFSVSEICGFHCFYVFPPLSHKDRNERPERWWGIPISSESDPVTACVVYWSGSKRWFFFVFYYFCIPLSLVILPIFAFEWGTDRLHEPGSHRGLNIHPPFLMKPYRLICKTTETANLSDFVVVCGWPNCHHFWKWVSTSYLKFALWTSHPRLQSQH